MVFQIPSGCKSTGGLEGNKEVSEKGQKIEKFFGNLYHFSKRYENLVLDLFSTTGSYYMSLYYIIFSLYVLEDLINSVVVEFTNSTVVLFFKSRKGRSF